MCSKKYLYGSLPPSTGHFFRCGPWILKVLPNFGSQDPQIPQEKCCKNTSNLKVKKEKSTNVHLASVDASPFPNMYFQVSAVRFQGASVTAGDFYGGWPNARQSRNWTGQGKAQPFKFPVAELHGVPWNLVVWWLGEFQLQGFSGFERWDVWCFPTQSFWGECWKSCLSLLRNELELQGFYFLNIGGSYFSKFLLEAKINKILADVKNLRKYFNGG